MTVTAIKNMSIEEKISTMELIWDDLCQQDKIESPSWHKDVLRARETRRETPMDWSEAKKQILSKIE